MFTHETGAFGPIPVLKGITCSLMASPRTRGLSGHGGSPSSARPGIVREGTGQRCPCSRGGLGRSLVCTGPRVPDPGAHPRPGSHVLPDRACLCPHVPAWHLPPGPPEGSVLVSLGHCMSLARSRCSVFVGMHFTVQASTCRSDGTPPFRQVCVGGDPAPVTWSQSWCQRDPKFFDI